MTKIKILQIIFFSLFILTLFSPFIHENTAEFSFMKLDIFTYLFSFKINLLFSLLLLIILLELIFGRLFCGFICPMGNLITFFDWLFKPVRKKKKKNKNLKILLYIPPGIILLIILFKLLNINIIGLVDPLPIVHRFFTLAFIPVLNKIFRPGYETTSHALSFTYILPVILLSGLIGERLWCRYICPLGFLHRLISLPARYLRKTDNCSSCSRCSQICPTNAINPDNPIEYDKTMCILCFRCVDKCPGNTVFKLSFQSHSKDTKVSSSRRDFMKTILLSLLFFNFRTRKRKGKNPPGILRPPGATSESIQDTCLRCMECAKICPTGVIQPAGLEHGMVNLYTPQLKFDMAYCDYNCNLCGKTCPNNAIQKLSLKQKKKWSIGKAKINKEKCVVYNQNVSCIVCEEYCPVPEKAVKLKKTVINNKKLLAPVIQSDLCIGCGICETKCPVHGAILIYPLK